MKKKKTPKLSRKKKFRKKRIIKRSFFLTVLLLASTIYLYQTDTLGFSSIIEEVKALSDNEQNEADNENSMKLQQHANSLEQANSPKETTSTKQKNEHDSNDGVTTEENRDKANNLETDIQEPENLVSEGKSASKDRLQVSDNPVAPDLQEGIVLTHKVEPGETLFSITKNYYFSKESQALILEHNGLAHDTTIKSGASLKIPNPDFIDTYEVKEGDTIFSLVRKYYGRSVFLGHFIALNGISDPSRDLKAGMKVIFPQPHEVHEHTVKPGETAYSILNTYYDNNTYVEALKEFNHITENSLQADTTIYIPNIFSIEGKGKASLSGMWIEIDKARHELTVYRNDQIVLQERVATGKFDSLTPEGTFQVITKLKNPWYSPKSIAGGDPDNPLGTRWLGLDVPGTSGEKYGIHGTNTPSSIGKDVSLGCVRMHNDKVEELFDIVPLGTRVVIK